MATAAIAHAEPASPPLRTASTSNSRSRSQSPSHSRSGSVSTAVDLHPEAGPSSHAQRSAQNSTDAETLDTVDALGSHDHDGALATDVELVNGEKPKSRASRACSSCNRQKLRCDGGQPCSRCVNLRIPESCEYLPSLRGKTRKRKEKPYESTTATSTAGGSNKKRRKSASPSARPPTIRPGGPEQVYPHTMDSEMALWKRDALLNGRGPPISALWGLDRPGKFMIQDLVHPAATPSRRTLPPISPLLNDRRGPINPAGLTTLPLPGDAHNPLAVLAEASAGARTDHDVDRPKNNQADSGPGQSRDALGAYYGRLERNLHDEAPHIMSFISVAEAEQLFELFFKYLHPHLPFVDRQHAQPYAVARRNNFLFNAICCVSARTFNVSLWDRLKDFARFEMERFPKEKNIDVIQGHLIFAMWNLIRPKHFEQDMSWLRVGVAVRAAIDINLHRVALIPQARDGLPSWILRSIIRTWLLSSIIDRTLSAQLGKPGTLRAENATAMYQKLLLEGDEKPTVDDVWVACLGEWTTILTRAIETFHSELRDHSPQDSDLISHQHSFPNLVRVFEKQFRAWRESSEERTSPFGAETRCVRLVIGNIRLYDHYARLVVHSFGLQRAVDALPLDLPATFAQYQTAAIRLINGFEVDLEKPGFTRGCPDFVYTMLTYAAVSLLKATEARFAHLDPHRPTIFMSARKAAEMLSRTAMTPEHLPSSQSVFINRLIEVKSAEKHTAETPDAFPEPIDFEAYGLSLDQDTGKTLWPPAPAANGTSRRPNGQGGVPNGANGVARGKENAGAGYPVPGAALGLGVGSFSQNQDMLFTQETFWKGILDGAQPPVNGLN